MGIRLKLGIIVLGIALAGWSAEERKLASLCKEVAAKMTCRQLGDEGTTDNAHVAISAFTLAPNFVYEKDKSSSDWSQIWVPAVAIDSPYAQKLAETYKAGGKLEDVPLPKPVSVIITTKEVRNQKAFEELDEKEELEGLVVNAISKIDGDTKRLLEESYGDISHAQILELGRKPANLALAYLGIVGGTLIALAGLAWLILGFVTRNTATPTAPKAAA